MSKTTTPERGPGDNVGRLGTRTSKRRSAIRKVNFVLAWVYVESRVSEHVKWRVWKKKEHNSQTLRDESLHK
jgi:hypothetical protein